MPPCSPMRERGIWAQAKTTGKPGGKRPGKLPIICTSASSRLCNSLSGLFHHAPAPKQFVYLPPALYPICLLVYGQGMGTIARDGFPTLPDLRFTCTHRAVDSLKDKEGRIPCQTSLKSLDRHSSRWPY